MSKEIETVSIWRRILSRLVTVTGTGAVLVVAGGSVTGGASLLAERADAVVGPEPAPLMSVSALRIAPQTELTVTRTFQGQVEPAQTVGLAFQQAGEIEALFVNEGDLVRAGQTLASLDTRILDAERQRLEASRRSIVAQTELARLTAQRQADLQEQGFASQQRFDTARFALADLEARIGELDAAIERLDVQLSQTRLVAPFDGVIANRFMDEGTVAGVGQAVVNVLENSTPVFRVGIDPALANVDALDGATIAIGGKVYDAVFDSFRSDLDRQTRTRTALFRLETDDAVYLQAGSLTLRPTLDQAGYLVPMRALQDGVRGLWTVLALRSAVDDGREGVYAVGLHAVEVLHLEGDMAYVAGTLADDMLIIADGTHRVVPGELVHILEGAL